MSQSGHRPGSSKGDDERPILSSFWDSQTDSEDWITGLCDYVTTMREHYPGKNHPDEAWLSKGFARISLDRERTVATNSLQGASGVGGQVSGGPASAAPRSLAAMQRNLDVTTSGVANLGLSSRSAHLNQQTKTGYSGCSPLAIRLHSSMQRTFSMSNHIRWILPRP